MSYITMDYYRVTFGGTAIPDDDAIFNRAAIDASVVIDGIVQKEISDEDLENEDFLNAVCYEAESIYLSGGMAAVLAKAAFGRKTSERLDDYDVTLEKDPSAETWKGVPVHPLALQLLRKLGYMMRWAYAEAYEDDELYLG